MIDAIKMKNAQSVFDSLCEMLDEKEIKYDKRSDKLSVTFGVRGDDIPISFILEVDAARDLVRFISPIPVIFPYDRHLVGAIAICQTNYLLASGNFDYDFTTGTVSFKITSSYKDSLISKDLLEYMVGVTCRTVDDFNDKFLMLAKGQLSLEDFLKMN